MTLFCLSSEKAKKYPAIPVNPVKFLVSRSEKEKVKPFQFSPAEPVD
jgi:hypothetical protein